MTSIFISLKTMGSTIAIIIALCTAYTISICIYRVFFHPLADYPGPWLAKVTTMYSGYHAWTGDIHNDMWRCHEKYGKIVRYAPDRIMVNSAKALEDVYSRKSNVVKSQVYDALVHRAPNILTLRDKVQHGHRRRVMSQALSDASVASFEGDIQHHVSSFIKVLTILCSSSQETGCWSNPVNIAKWCHFLTFDIIAKIVFSAEYDMLGKPTHRQVLDALLQSNVRMGVLFQVPGLRKWRIHEHFFPTAIAARRVFVRFVTRMVTERIDLSQKEATDNIKKERLDVFGRLMVLEDPETGSKLSMAELGAESTTLIAAGSDTTSATLAATLFYLAQNTDAQRRARKEVRAAFPSANDIHLGPTLSNCSFLAACINESLRLSPPVGSVPWRLVLDGGIVVDGNYFPPGCDIGVSIYSVQRCKHVYDDPYDFIPERWLVRGEKERQILHSSWSPFSRGPSAEVASEEVLPWQN